MFGANTSQTTFEGTLSNHLTNLEYGPDRYVNRIWIEQRHIFLDPQINNGQPTMNPSHVPVVRAVTLINHQVPIESISEALAISETEVEAALVYNNQETHHLKQHHIDETEEPLETFWEIKLPLD